LRTNDERLIAAAIQLLGIWKDGRPTQVPTPTYARVAAYVAMHRQRPGEVLEVVELVLLYGVGIGRPLSTTSGSWSNNWPRAYRCLVNTLYVSACSEKSGFDAPTYLANLP